MTDDDTGDESIRQEARKALADEFGNADFPVSSQMDFLPALSAGPTTRFEFGNQSLTAMDLATSGADMDFPYESLDDFLDDALDAMENQGYFDQQEE